MEIHYYRWSGRSSVVDDVSSRQPRGPFAAWHVDQATDRPGWTWSVVSNQVTTNRSGGREVRGQITQSGDRRSVTKWPPTDQFPDERLGQNARSNRALISHRVQCHRGLVLHAVKLGLRFPARALRTDLAWAHLRESCTRVAWGS